MNTDELKKLLKGSTAVLILENGEPSFVILGYDAYKGLVSEQEEEVKINRLATDLPDADVETPSRPVSSETAAQPRPFKKERGQRDSAQLWERDGQFRHRVGEKESELLEKINRQILALKDDIDKEEKSTEISAVD